MFFLLSQDCFKTNISSTVARPWPYSVRISWLCWAGWQSSAAYYCPASNRLPASCTSGSTVPNVWVAESQQCQSMQASGTGQFCGWWCCEPLCCIRLGSLLAWCGQYIRQGHARQRYAGNCKYTAVLASFLCVDAFLFRWASSLWGWHCCHH